MTTTEPRLAPASADTIRDPDWIADRLRDALDGDLLVYAIRDLLADISLWTSTAEEIVRSITQRASLPPLEWDRRNAVKWDGTKYLRPPQLVGYVGEFEHDDHIAVAEQWATELRLTETDDPVSPGTREWVGEIEGWMVSIWAIADRCAFEADL